jgi:phenylacetate-coenzyme A ligase PaaK-like adenylate-forming protein
VRSTPDASGLPREELIVRVEAAEAEHERLGIEVPQLVSQAVMVTPRVEFVAAGTLYDPVGNIKAKRFVDERHAA